MKNIGVILSIIGLILNGALIVKLLINYRIDMRENEKMKKTTEEMLEWLDAHKKDLEKRLEELRNKSK